jgi:hypothetical protein
MIDKTTAIVTAVQMLRSVGMDVQLAINESGMVVGFYARGEMELTPSQREWVDALIAGMERYRG